jgi:hypothetical protein
MYDISLLPLSIHPPSHNFKPKNENLQTDYEDSPTTIFRKPKINENVAASASRTDNTGELR